MRQVDGSTRSYQKHMFSIATMLLLLLLPLSDARNKQPWEAEQDLHKLYEKIKGEVKMDGLKWAEGECQFILLCRHLDVKLGATSAPLSSMTVQPLLVDPCSCL